MNRTRSRRGERGSTIIEVMVATVVLIIAGLGFAGTSQYASGATGIGHRRTVTTLIRAGLIDRLNVTPRTALRTVAAAGEGTWIVDACFDQASQLLTANSTWAAGFTCPAGTYYRSWISVKDNGTDPWAATTNAWTVGLYVERMDRGCAAADRYASVGCSAADLLLTD
jgi:Tfp pilus assembly protein PilV